MSTAAKAKRTIELNGKLYDAHSGRIINDTVTAAFAAHSAQKTAIKPPTQGTAVDGFVKRPHANTQPTASGHTYIAVTATKIRPTHARTAPVPAPKKLQRSQTLMRPAVKKPGAIAKHDTQDTPRLKKENSARHFRAAQVSKSYLIQRFNLNSQPTIVKKQAVMPVAAPVSAATQQITQQVAHLATSTEAHVKQSVDIIEESLRNASAHLEKFEDNVLKSSFWERFGFKHKAGNIASLSVAGLLLMGFFAYQNAPNIEMRLAAASSGVSAHMPGYHPAGYSVERDVQAEPGRVTLSFRSNTDNKNFTVTQQASNWSSDALLNNHVLANKKQYQTHLNEGRTVFIYDNTSATWVNGGVWYKIEGNASLTNDQLLRIANSL